MAEDTATALIDDVEIQEALQYWGDLITRDRESSELLDRLLAAVAQYIVSDASDLTKEQGDNSSSPPILNRMTMKILPLRNLLPFTILLAPTTMCYSSILHHPPLR